MEIISPLKLLELEVGYVKETNFMTQRKEAYSLYTGNDGSGSCVKKKMIR